MKHNYERLVEKYLSDLATEIPAIVIDGLKGVGKTVSTKRISNTVFELDTDRDQIRMKNFIETLSDEKKPILIDEWQRMPRVWDYVRRAVDDGAGPGSFLLTGSMANLDLNIHSGAGRIVRKKMYPLSLAERKIGTPTVSLKELLSSDVPFSAEIKGSTEVSFKQYLHEIAASGLPGVRRISKARRKNMLDSYFSNLLTHDFQLQGVRLRQPHTLMRWLRAYAAAISTNSGYNEILDASTAGEGAKPAAKTTIAYREALGNLWLLEELPVWIEGENFFSGLKMTPKHYLIDPAFAVHLLGLDEDMLAAPGEADSDYAVFDRKYGSIIGRLFEALVFLDLKVYSGVNDADLSYVATAKNDHEIDFVVSKARRAVAFEVKLAPYIEESDVRHLLWLKEKAAGRIRDAVVITTGPYAYRREDGIAVVPAALLGA